MAKNLFTVDIKSLDQQISNPTVGAGNANGAGMRIVFSQEANAAFSDNTQVYLKWTHQESGLKGYNAFTRVGGPNQYPPYNPGQFYPQPGYYPPPGHYPPPPPHPYPPKDANVWEIMWPKQMLREGNVICTVELVDNISIYSTNSFTVRVLVNPHDGEPWTDNPDFTIFQEAIIALNSTIKDARHMMRRMREDFSEFERQIDNIEDVANGAKQEALDVKESLKRHIQLSDEEFEQIKTDLQTTTENLQNTISELSENISISFGNVANEIQDVQKTIAQLEQDTNEKFSSVRTNISEMRDSISELETQTDDSEQKIAELEQAILDATEIVELI